MSARERILARIRERQGKPYEIDPVELAAVRTHLAAHPRSPGPRDAWDVNVRFRERATSLASTIDEAAVLSDVPALAAQYLRGREVPPRAVCWRELGELDWRGAGLDVEVRPAHGDDLVGITGVFCGISETGTLMTLSSPDSPSTVSLLPETHIAVLQQARIVRSMEDAWALVRTEVDGLPRAVSFISGPSRTADIEQTVTLGAHGPYRVHIIIVGG
ncbi:MAG: L-lactate dehydrogenase complex protein LldG [Betaproteobacteria bacterium]|jgi:L-lactate dehydrogenase complex protein LldG|nr:L-lactate dehydrogenase complex protein LldG [Betaproteobacteria bacterium]